MGWQVCLLQVGAGFHTPRPRESENPWGHSSLLTSAFLSTLGEPICMASQLSPMGWGQPTWQQWTPPDSLFDIVGLGW